MKDCRRIAHGDLPAVTRLFNEGVEAGDLTADVARRTEEQMASWLLSSPPPLESYVVDAGAGAVAWAALTRHHEREAYGPTAELTLYVDRAYRRRGMGATLGTLVIERARALSLHSLVALVPAARSHATRTAKKLGFAEIGVLRGVFPFEADLLDVALFQLRLAPSSAGA
jgi:L-amino acid N-acyltransferase YncA